MEVMLGSYAQQPRMEMFGKEAPAPGQPAPDLVSLRGSRALLLPEIETEVVIKSSWMKKLPDASVTWRARNLYSNIDHVFNLVMILYISCNTRLRFSVIDGGLLRRALVFPFDFTFDPNPRHEHQRQGLPENIKSEAFIKPLLPAYLYLLTVASHVLFKDGKGIGKIPERVSEATEDFISIEGSNHVMDVIKDCTEQCNARDATTRTVFVKFVTDQLKPLDMTQSVVAKIISNTVTYHNTKFGREKVRLIQGGQYLKFKS
jgi:phage/plasmid-associated DNA primase